MLNFLLLVFCHLLHCFGSDFAMQLCVGLLFAGSFLAKPSYRRANSNQTALQNHYSTFVVRHWSRGAVVLALCLFAGRAACVVASCRHRTNPSPKPRQLHSNSQPTNKPNNNYLSRASIKGEEAVCRYCAQPPPPTIDITKTQTKTTPTPIQATHVELASQLTLLISYSSKPLLAAQYVSQPLERFRQTMVRLRSEEKRPNQTKKLKPESNCR